MSTKVQRWSRAKQIKERIIYVFNCIYRYSQYLMEWYPYKKNRICCVTLTRKGYVDNMRYVSQALLKKNCNFEIIWITKYPDTCDSAIESGLKVVRYHTIRHFYLQFTARMILSDDSLYHGMIKRKKQIYLNLWHGGINYKRLGREGMAFEDPFMNKLFYMKNPPPDYMVAGSRFFAENMRTAFGFYRTVFLNCGMPRNDILFHSKETRGKIKKLYHIGNKRVILYAPTFREQGDGLMVSGIAFEEIIKAARERFGGEWVMLYRAHYFVSETGVHKEYVIDVSDYENMQDILIDTDILISDYSSCMWDYSFLYRPIIVYAPDEEHYRKMERGFTRAGETMPYPKSKNMAELLKIIETHDFDEDTKRIERHHKEMGAYDTGNATDYIADFILSKMRNDKEDGDEKSHNIRNL